MPLLELRAELRYVLYLAPDAPGEKEGRAFATAAYLQFQDGKHWFHRICFHEYARDAPADGFRERIPQTVWPMAFVTPNASTVRGLMDLAPDAMLGIDPGLEFSWRRDRVKSLPAGFRLTSESVVLSVPTITA